LAGLTDRVREARRLGPAVVVELSLAAVLTVASISFAAVSGSCVDDVDVDLAASGELECARVCDGRNQTQ